MKKFRVLYRVISHEMMDAVEAENEQEAKLKVERVVFERLATENGVFDVEFDKVLEL